MSAIGPRANQRRILVGGLIGTLAVAYFGAIWARAAVPDACGTTTEHKMARALELGEAIQHKRLLTQEGNPSGVLRVGCRVFAWKGKKPVNDKLKREALLEGRLAWLHVQTWVMDQSPYAPVWRAHFDAERGAIRSASVDLFLRRLHGRAFTPPHFGAEEAIAYVGSTRKVVKARGLWWNHRDKSMIEVDVEEARGKAAVAALKRIGSLIVLPFNTECIYPCEPPASG